MPKKGDIAYSTDLELDLATVVPSVAGPKRPQDRIELGKLKEEFVRAFSKPVAENGFGKPAEDLARAFPVGENGRTEQGGGSQEPVSRERSSDRTPIH
jgi:aconitate hydratase